jgi:hypothetical protein
MFITYKLIVTEIKSEHFEDVRDRGLDSSGSGYKLIADSYEYGNEPSGSIKC